MGFFPGGGEVAEAQPAGVTDLVGLQRRAQDQRHRVQGDRGEQHEDAVTEEALGPRMTAGPERCRCG